MNRKFHLKASSGVISDARGFVAATDEPWLEITPRAAFRPGRIVEIRYFAGLEQQIARPILRFRSAGGRCWDALMPAPSEGMGIWRGRVPPETAAVLVSPLASAGRFTFEIDSVRTLGAFAQAPWRMARPKRSFFASSARMVGLRDEADLNLRWVFGQPETQDCAQWKRARALPAPRGVETGPLCIVIVNGRAASADSLSQTLASLQAQSFGNWRLVVLDAPAFFTPGAESRVAMLRSAAELNAPDGALVARLEPGDQIDPEGLAAFVALFARRPEITAAYCDEVRAGPQPAPVFKPDWSPIRQEWAPYVGRAAFVRWEAFRAQVMEGTPEEAIDLCLRAASAVGHLRRAAIRTQVRAPALRRAQAIARAPAPRGAVAIVIPTKDRIDLLAPCIESLFEKTVHPEYRVVVVDNGSTEPRTFEAFERWRAREPRLSVLPAPGPFNFSKLCNDGASSVESDFLLFLNNDTVVLQGEWITQLQSFAARGDIGAVGARLLYPDLRVQHAGVVIGLGGVAGHFGEGAAEPARGWLDGDAMPHEASAVTGACLMVAREKFDAVGGFDEANLPVDLNDVDLCLRLNQKGWRTVCDGRTHLLHFQSASRGGGLRLQSVYDRERRYFMERWSGVIRDDPYFNPNLSLYDLTPKLG